MRQHFFKKSLPPVASFMLINAPATLTVHWGLTARWGLCLNAPDRLHWVDPLSDGDRAWLAKGTRESRSLSIRQQDASRYATRSKQHRSKPRA